MKKFAIAVCLASSIVSAYGSSNIIPINQLMFHSIVPENAQEQLAKKYPTYANYLTDTDVLLLLNYIDTTDKAIIVKFSADWCGPCKRLAPIVHDAAQVYDSQVIVIEVNIDNYPAVRSMFDISVVPTLIYFKNGVEIDRTHSVSKQALLDKIEELITQKSDQPTP